MFASYAFSFVVGLVWVGCLFADLLYYGGSVVCISLLFVFYFILVVFVFVFC